MYASRKFKSVYSTLQWDSMQLRTVQYSGKVSTAAPFICMTTPEHEVSHSLYACIRMYVRMYACRHICTCTCTHRHTHPHPPTPTPPTYTNFCLLKEFPDLLLRLPRDACDNLGGCQLEEGEVQLPCNGMSHQRLPTTRGSVQKEPTGRGNTQLTVHLRVAEVKKQLANLLHMWAEVSTYSTDERGINTATTSIKAA